MLKDHLSHYNITHHSSKRYYGSKGDVFVHIFWLSILYSVLKDTFRVTFLDPVNDDGHLRNNSNTPFLCIYKICLHSCPQNDNILCIC